MMASMFPRKFTGYLPAVKGGNWVLFLIYDVKVA
jgi:hypothetical protein